VLGGSGFIGTRLVDRLLADDVEVTVLDHRASAAAQRHPGIRALETTVTEDSVTEVLERESVGAVFHLAGPASVPASVDDPIDDLNGTTVTTVAALEALRRVPSEAVFVYASSAAVYGDAVYHPMDEDHPLEPKSPYGVAKLASERYVRLYARLHGIRGFSVRPFSVYGPGQRQLVVYDLLKRMHAGERPLKILGSPDVSRDFVFVGDMARALVTLARSAPGDGQFYNIASGKPTTLQELASTLVEVAGIRTEIEFTGKVRPGDPLHWTGDPQRARNIGVECDTPLAEGLRQTVEWFRTDAPA
jgi:UDP-glucose 4-epimerase